MTPEERADRDMSEVPTLTDAVVKLAKQHGWRVFRVRQGKPGWNLGSGWPDLTLLRRERMVCAELKRQDKDLETAQREWAEALSAAGAEVYLWRPRDLRIGLIEQLLT